MVREGPGCGSQRKWLRAPVVFGEVAEAVKKALLTSHGYVDQGRCGEIRGAGSGEQGMGPGAIGVWRAASVGSVVHRGGKP